MARTRSAAVSQALPAKVQSGRQALKEKTNTLPSRVPQYENDGNTEDLIKDAKERRGQPRKTIQSDVDLVMTGGLGLGYDSSDGSHDRVLATANNTTNEGEMDHEIAQATRKRNRRQRAIRKVIPNESQREIFAGMKKRMENTARAERSQHVPSASGAIDADDVGDMPARSPASVVAAAIDSISPSPPRIGRSSLAHPTRSSIVPPGSVLKIQGTPAMESSLLALRNFKRRPRQPSMLQMVQQRTASARPSAVHIPADEESSDLEFDLDDIGDDDNFAPDAEGTPMKLNKPERMSSEKNRTPSGGNGTVVKSQFNGNVRKRKSDEIGSSSALLRFRQEKRQRRSNTRSLNKSVAASEEIIAPDDSVTDIARTLPTDPATNIEVPHSSPPSSPPLDSMSPIQREDPLASNVLVASSWQSDSKRHAERQNDNPDESGFDDADGTLADPMSSSPLLEPQRNINDRKELSDRATQLSPTLKRSKRRDTGEKALSTAQLQILLPRRRKGLGSRKQKTTYDLDSESDTQSFLDPSSLDDDEDELSATLTVQSRARITLKKSQPSRVIKGTKKTGTIPKRRTISQPLQEQVGRTYSKKNVSDEENDDRYESPLEDAEDSTVQDISLTMQEVSKSNELAEAKRKFAEVDDWDMEFESFSAEDHRSSSFGWR